MWQVIHLGEESSLVFLIYPVHCTAAITVRKFLTILSYNVHQIIPILELTCVLWGNVPVFYPGILSYHSAQSEQMGSRSISKLQFIWPSKEIPNAMSGSTNLSGNALYPHDFCSFYITACGTALGLPPSAQPGSKTYKAITSLMSSHINSSVLLKHKVYSRKWQKMRLERQAGESS